MDTSIALNITIGFVQPSPPHHMGVEVGDSRHPPHLTGPSGQVPVAAAEQQPMPRPSRRANCRRRRDVDQEQEGRPRQIRRLEPPAEPIQQQQVAADHPIQQPAQQPQQQQPQSSRISQ
mmetsp:Transcript_34189/g.84660  ORF Transcript_34189/g.84660 Transcript_34189/m.84660 type:complete len:119 (+) Transcript_34189:581-937(+)